MIREIQTKLYKIKRNLLNLNYYKFQIWKIRYPKAINSRYKKNVSSMFNYSKGIFDWFRDDALHLMYEYDLSERSLVVDVGGYTGHWSREIIERYNCNLIVYEPINEYCSKLKKKLFQYDNVKIYNYGLGHDNYKAKVELRGVQTTTMDYEVKNYDEIIEIIDVAEENELINSKIDLISINIEGGEYKLLNRMLEINIVQNFSNIQIQFHEWYPSYTESKILRDLIQNKLSRTHELTYCYPFVWENWKLKNN